MHTDLHTHTTASDGRLSPSQLLARAEASGLDMLAITDHDTVAAYSELPARHSLHIVPGIEFSAHWRNQEIHILGLNIDTRNPDLLAGIAMQQQSRNQRADRIADKLARIFSIDNPLAAVERMAAHGSIGRPHFARFMVEHGLVRDATEAFDKYLRAGKRAHVAQQWMPCHEAVERILAAGGTAVLAHPLKYRLTRTRLLGLIDAFRQAGGRGLEVISGNQSGAATTELARLCTGKSLLASRGSDFHQPDQPWSELGRQPPLPAGCRPVWEAW